MSGGWPIPRGWRPPPPPAPERRPKTLDPEGASLAATSPWWPIPGRAAAAACSAAAAACSFGGAAKAQVTLPPVRPAPPRTAPLPVSFTHTLGRRLSFFLPALRPAPPCTATRPLPALRGCTGSGWQPPGRTGPCPWGCGHGRPQAAAGLLHPLAQQRLALHAHARPLRACLHPAPPLPTGSIAAPRTHPLPTVSIAAPRTHRPAHTGASSPPATGEAPALC